MSVAETAVLAVELKLNGVTAYTSGMNQVHSANAKAAAGVGGLTGGLKNAEKGLASFSGRIGHAKGAIGGLLTGPLGVLGLSAGVFSLGTILEKTIGHTTDFAFSVEKLMGLTGGTAEAMSGLLAVFEKFGVNAERTGMIVGFAEKTLGKLAANGKLSNKILEDYGFAVRNANGTVKTFGQTLNYVSDYYNANHSAASKAALAAQIFGRGYADLIPILKLGAKGIRDAELAAADLGLTLTAQNAVELKDYRRNLRELADAASGLQLQIGLALVPSINEMAKSLTSFVRDNRQGIVRFFKEAAANVGKFGDFIRKDVIPPLKSFGSAAASAWAAVPDPLKQILIGGVIANKAGKFLFDFGLKDAAGLLKGGLGALGDIGRGATPATPVFVKDVGGGLPGAAAAGGVPLAALAAGAAIIASPLIIRAIVSAMNPSNAKDSPWGYDPSNGNWGATNAGGLPPGVHTGSRTPPMPGYGQFLPGTGYSPGPSGGGSAASRGGAASLDAVRALREFTAALVRGAHSLETNWIKNLDGIGARSKAVTGKDATPAQIAAIRTRDEIHQLKVITEKSHAVDTVKLERLRVLAADAKAHGDTVTAKKIQTAIDKMKADLKAAATATTAAVSRGTDVVASTIRASAGSRSDLNVYVTTNVSATNVAKTIVKTRRYDPGSP